MELNVTGYGLLINIHEGGKCVYSYKHIYFTGLFTLHKITVKNTSRRRASSYLFLSFNTINIQRDNGR